MKFNFVLCYHRISNLESGGLSKLAVSPSRFESQLKLISKFFTPVTLEDCTNFVPNYSFAITFDDGYSDNKSIAMPVLQKLDLPATFFISTSYIGNSWFFIPDILDVAFSSPSQRDTLFKILREFGIRASNENSDYWSILEIVFALERSTFLNLVAKLSQQYGRNILEIDQNRRPMLLDELCELKSFSKVSIGLHSHTHRNLSSLSEEEFVYEIDESINFFRTKGIEFQQFFAIPFGTISDFLDSQVQWLAHKGLVALSTEPLTIIGGRRLNPNPIPRICVQEWHPIFLLLIIITSRAFSKSPGLWRFVRLITRKLKGPAKCKSGN